MKGLQRMVDNIYWAQGCACFRKSSPLIPYFNKLVFELKDSGLMLNYETQVIKLLYIINIYEQLH